MLARRSRVAVLVLSVAALFALAFAVQAQSSPAAANTCPDVVSQSLTSLGTSCASVAPNTTCYGHDNMNVAAFTQSGVQYTAPGDQAPLSQVEAIQTGQLNLETGNWGVNLMNVMANIPTAVSSKGVVFVQFGGVEVESGVDPSKAVSGLATGIAVSTSSSTDLRTWPLPSISGHASDVVTTVPSGAAITVDAISPDKTYVRAVYKGGASGVATGWLLKSALDQSVDLGTLPTIGPDTENYFQDFYFRTGVGHSAEDCMQSTSLLFVQGPNHAPADLKVFGQPVRIESTMVLLSLPPGNGLGSTLELIDLTGLIRIYPDTPDELIVPPGFKTTIALCSDFESAGIQGDADEKATCGKFTTPVELTNDELASLKVLEDIPPNDINYPIHIPIRITASGAGTVDTELVFPDPAALQEAKDACAAGELPQSICQYLNV